LKSPESFPSTALQAYGLEGSELVEDYEADFP